MGFQGEWKLVALSAPYRLKHPDRRFEELKNYSTELQTHINNIIKIRTVSGHVVIIICVNLYKLYNYDSARASLYRNVKMK